MFFVLPVFALFILVVIWQSGVLGDMVSSFLGQLLPWLFFPVAFVLGTLLVTDHTPDLVAAIFSVLIPLLYMVGGVIQIRVSYRWANHLTVRRVMARDTHPRWPIAFRVRIWGAIAVVVGCLGVVHPQPLHDLFREHKAGLPLKEAAIRMFREEPEPLERALTRLRGLPVEPKKAR